MNFGILVFPNVEERYTKDGNIWSAAGVSAGIDAMLAFIESFAGEQTAGIMSFAAGGIL